MPGVIPPPLASDPDEPERPLEFQLATRRMGNDRAAGCPWRPLARRASLIVSSCEASSIVSRSDPSLSSGGEA